MSAYQNVGTAEHRNAGMSKCRNAEKTPLLLMNLINHASGKHGKSRKHKYESPTSTTSTAGRRGNCNKYGGRGGATATSHVTRFISICRCRFPIYPIIQVCSFFDRLPDCQSFMIYFITLQGSFPQKNGVLIKILLRARNNGRFIEINSARKARKSIYPSRVKA